MSSTYAGVATNYPALLTLPTDGDKLRASTFRPGLEGLADRTAYNAARLAELTALAQPMRAVNWPTKVTNPVTGAEHAHYFSDRWYVLGTTETASYSLDRGLTWTSDAALAGVLAGETLTWMASTYFPTISSPVTGLDGGQSRMLVATDHVDGKVAYYDGSSWSLITLPGALVLVAAPQPRVVYDPVNNTWVWTCPLAAGVHHILYSSDPSVGWTVGSFGSTTWNGGTAFEIARLAVRADTGRIIGVTYDPSLTRYEFIKSDDGGATWQDLTTVAATLEGVPERASIIFNEHDGSWICMFSRVTGLSGQVLRSTDNGATWTVMRTFTEAAPGEIACFEGVLLGTATIAGGIDVVMYSLDDGANWRRALELDGAAVGVFVGAGQPLALTDASLYLGLVAGTPPALAVG